MKYFRQLMRSGKKQSKLSNWLSSIFMMLALAWLTVCLPVVYGAQQERTYIAAENQSTPDADDDNTSNPLANTTEETTPNNVNLSEEYLHDAHAAEQIVAVPSTHYTSLHVPIYIAFHGELISPPPDVA